jgi:hypothetical protein
VGSGPVLARTLILPLPLLIVAKRGGDLHNEGSIERCERTYDSRGNHPSKVIPVRWACGAQLVTIRTGTNVASRVRVGLPN